MRAKRRWTFGRILAVLGKTLLMLVLVAALIVAGALAGADTDRGRELIRTQVNALLADTFRGRIEIQRIGWLGLRGAGGLDVEIFDQQGRRVLRGRGLAAFTPWPSIAYAAVTRPTEPLLIELRPVSADHVEVHLIDDGTGAPTLAAVFEPKTAATEPSEGETHVRIDGIAIRHTWVHGALGGSPPLDVEVKRARATLASDPRLTTIDLVEAELAARGLPLRADPSGRVAFALRAPAPASLELSGRFWGKVREAPLFVAGAYREDGVQATAFLPGVPPETVRELAPGLEPRAPATLFAEVHGRPPELEFRAWLAGTFGRVRAGGSARLEAPRRLKAVVEVDDFDANALVAGAPATKVDLSASALAELAEDDSFTLRYGVSSAPSVVAGYPLAKLDFAGQISGEAPPSVAGETRGEARRVSLEGTGRWHERGLGTDFRYSAQLSPAVSGVVRLDAQVRDPPLLGRLVAGARAQGRVRAELTGDPAQVRAGVRVELADLRLPGFRAKPLRMHGRFEARGQRAHATLDGSFTTQGRETRVKADVTKQGDSLSGDVEATLPRGSRVRVSAERLRGVLSAQNARALEAASGRLVVEGTLELADAEPLVEAGVLPVANAEGSVDLKFVAERTPPARKPMLSGFVRTRKLALRGLRGDVPEDPTNQQAIAAEPWSVRGIDAELELGFLGDTRALSARGRVYDLRGDLIRLTAETRLPQGVGEAKDLLAALDQTPLSAQVQVPARDLAHWPPAWRVATARGRVGLQADLSGTARDPHLSAILTAERIRGLEQEKQIPRGFDVRAALDYQRARGSLLAEGRVSSASSLAARVEWKGDVVALPAALTAGSPSPVQAEARVDIAQFPLELLPWLRQRGVEGRLSGRAELSGFGERPKMAVTAKVERFRAAGVPLHKTELSAKLEGRALEGQIDVGCEGGTLLGKGRTEMEWGNRVVPTVGDRLNFELRTRRFRVGSIQPLFPRVVSELDGWVDADVAAELGAGKPELRGKARWSEGVIQLPAIGQRLHDVEARVELARGELRLPELRARGVTGRLRASASARLDGLDLRSAQAELRIAEKDKIPVTVEGASLGDAWGRLAMRLTRPDEKTTRVEIDVPRMHLLMPEASPSDVQPLEPAEAIRVGTPGQDGKFVVLPLQPIQEATESDGSKMVVAVKLGRDVWIHQGDGVGVQLGGEVRAEMTDETRLLGRIQLAGGMLDVSGKRFEIERGMIDFRGEVADAQIAATARWDSPAGYRVYAEYSGTVENGKIVMRAEPPLSQDEILSLLLFGAPDGSFGSGPPQDESATAVAVAGGTASKGVNRVLSRFTQLDVSTRIDTSTGAARPELVVQITPRIAARLTHALGEPAPGQSPDRNFLTLELRLVRRWSLSTVFGDQGSSAVDMIWRHRY